MRLPDSLTRVLKPLNPAHWSKPMKFGTVLAAVAAGAVACSAQAVDVPGPVVSAEWLHKNLSGVTVLDVRYDLATFTSKPQFEQNAKTGAKELVAPGGHIPGALGVDYGALRVTRKIDNTDIPKLVPDQAAFQALMQSIGLNSGKPVIITSPGEDLGYLEAATRLYWSLKYYGQQSMAMLDGGNAAWIQAGYPVGSDAAPKRTGNWVAKAADETLRAETSEVEAALKAGSQIVDARPAIQYTGLFYKKPKVKAGGHVAGAKLLPPEVRSRNAGVAAVFLSPAEYRTVYEAMGIDADAPTVTYCNTGHLASGAWFIQHEILGNKNASLYDGSMTEWTTLGHPVVGLNSTP